MVTMEYRKLMAFGKSSYIVSVPKGWVKKNSLKKGEVLAVEQKPNELIFTVNKDSTDKPENEAIIDAKDKTVEELKCEIISFYIVNCSLFRVVNVKDTEAVKEIFRNLSGIEVIEEQARQIVAKDLLDITELSLDKIIRRIDIIIRSMMIDCQDSELSDYQSVIGRDKEVNRMCLLGFRTAKAEIDDPRLLKRFNVTYWNVMVSKQVIADQEKFADQVKRVIRFRKNSEKSWTNEMKALMKKISSTYHDVMKIYYDKDIEVACREETKVRELMKECRAIVTSNRSVDIITMAEYFQHMIDSLKKILRNVLEWERSK